MALESYYGLPASRVQNPSTSDGSSIGLRRGDTGYWDVLERLFASGDTGDADIQRTEGAVENPGDPSTARANTRLRAASQVYYKTQGDAINAVHQALRGSGYDWDPSGESWSHIGYEQSSGQKLISIGDNSYLHLSMYRMPSGSYELNAYVDRGARGGRRNPQPGRAYMLSYLPAGGGSFKTIPYATMAKAAGGMQARMGQGTLRMEVRDMRSTPSVPVLRWDPSRGVQRLNPRSSRGGNADIVDQIHVGDKVVVTNRFGQERAGRAVMKGPHGWVLNMGGPHGTPHVATNEDIVKVIRKGTRLDRLEYTDTEENPSRLPEGVTMSTLADHVWKAWMRRSRLDLTVENFGGPPRELHIKIEANYEGGPEAIQLWTTEKEGRYGVEKLRIEGRDTWQKKRLVDAINNFSNTGVLTNPGSARRNPVSTPDSFTRAYIEAALFSTNDESTESGGAPLDENYSIADISGETKEKMYADCAKFQELAGDLIAGEYERAGHDFWLTRNGHGAGFWDGDWPEPQATQLTKLSKRFGEYDLYVGDNGTIYGTGGRVVNPCHSGQSNPEGESRELQLYIENDGDLYRRQYTPILKNLALKKAKGVYQHHLAVKLFMYLVDEGAKKYTREFDAPGAKWFEVFSKSDRVAVAENLTDSFEVEYDLGNYSHLLPGKYQTAPKSNPEPEATEMYETFHGEPSREILEVEEEHHYHENLAALGSAIEMLVKTVHGPTVKITFDGNTQIACNEAGTQLYIVDGDQSLDLKTLGFKGKGRGKHGEYTDEKDKVLVGEIQELTYRTRKSFDRFKLTDYYHGLGEDSGVRPSLVYDLLNKQMEIVGGQYKVLDVGIVN